MIVLRVEMRRLWDFSKKQIFPFCDGKSKTLVRKKPVHTWCGLMYPRKCLRRNLKSLLCVAVRSVEDGVPLRDLHHVLSAAEHVLSRVWFSVTMDCSPPGSSVHGISQSRTLERAAISFSWGSFQSMDLTLVTCTSLLWEADSLQLTRGSTKWEAALHILSLLGGSWGWRGHHGWGQTGVRGETDQPSGGWSLGGLRNDMQPGSELREPQKVSFLCRIGHP